MPDKILASTEIEERFEQVLAELLQAEERGELLDLSQVFHESPELETRLHEFFRNRDGFNKLASQLAPSSARPELPAPQAELPPGSRVGSYEIRELVGRGGRGIVYRVNDAELNRPLAVKVLRPELRDDPDAVRRFLEEAQVMGQLQHPGIVPIHDIGQLPDSRPYFAMKLVQGRTLAALLTERPDPTHDLPRFLVHFQQVCQAVAYAHSRGVIHRDLKPANVMVGAFAEVQVMDWGLAKVLTGDIARREPLPCVPGTLAPCDLDTIRTVRSEATGLSSADGLVVGTIPYMSPEQAKGQVDQIDSRSDVFGLGAVLCDVLTGQPPYTGVPALKLHLMAAAGDLADAFARLDRSGADAELIALAKECLAPERERRPRDAGAVAARLATYLAGVQERLRQAEIEKAAAQVRAEATEAKVKAERRARRLAGGLIAAALLLLLGAGGAWLWWDRRQAEERSSVTADLDQFRVFQQKEQWDDARAALQRAEGRLSSGGAPDLHQRIRQGRADLEMVSRIEEVRVPQIRLSVGGLPPRVGTSSGNETASLQDQWKEGLFATEKADADFAEAFRKYGLDLPALDPATAAERIAASSIKEQLLAALDDWVAVKWTRDVAGRDRLLAIARRVDSDEWRNRFRDYAVQGNRQRLEELARQPEVAKQPPAMIQMLGVSLARLKAYAAAMTLLQSAQRQHPGNFWINHDLGLCLMTQRGRGKEAAGYLQAALALRPQSRPVRRNLGWALAAQGRLVEAENLFRDILESAPGDAATYSSLGTVLDKRGKLEEAVAAFRKAIELKPNSIEAHGSLAMTLAEQGKLDEAHAAHQKALALNRKDARLHCNFGTTLQKMGRHAEARAAFEEAIRLQPDLSSAHLNLGGLLCDKLHDYDAAIASFRRCLKCDPDRADAYYGIGNCWADKGVPEEAIASYIRAIRLKPNHAWAHCNLGIRLAAKGDLVGAIFEYRTALHIQPRYPEALDALGNAMQRQGKVRDAIRLHRQAIQLRPREGLFHFNLGSALQADGALNEAIAEYRTTTSLRPDFDGGWIMLAGALRQNRELKESIKVWKEVTRLFPHLAAGHTGLGNALADKGLLDEAIGSYHKALDIDPKDSLAHCNLGRALLELGRWAEAGDATRRCLDLLPARHPLRAKVTQQLQQCEEALKKQSRNTK